MTGKILNSMKALAPEVVAAGSELHHLILGPGPDLEAEWRAAGLELPDLARAGVHSCDSSWRRAFRWLRSNNSWGLEGHQGDGKKMRVDRSDLARS